MEGDLEDLMLFITGQIVGECTIERVCLLMNIVPCNEINLDS